MIVQIHELGHGQLTLEKACDIVLDAVDGKWTQLSDFSAGVCLFVCVCVCVCVWGQVEVIPAYLCVRHPYFCMEHTRI